MIFNIVPRNKSFHFYVSLETVLYKHIFVIQNFCHVDINREDVAPTEWLNRNFKYVMKLFCVFQVADLLTLHL